jgi:hypothetical protein
MSSSHVARVIINDGNGWESVDENNSSVLITKFSCSSNLISLFMVKSFLLSSSFIDYLYFIKLFNCLSFLLLFIYTFSEQTHTYLGISPVSKDDCFLLNWKRTFAMKTGVRTPNTTIHDPIIIKFFVNSWSGERD